MKFMLGFPYKFTKLKLTVKAQAINSLMTLCHAINHLAL